MQQFNNLAACATALSSAPSSIVDGLRLRLQQRLSSFRLESGALMRMCLLRHVAVTLSSRRAAGW